MNYPSKSPAGRFDWRFNATALLLGIIPLALVAAVVWRSWTAPPLTPEEQAAQRERLESKRDGLKVRTSFVGWLPRAKSTAMCALNARWPATSKLACE
jgi:hypothetical protein